MATSNTSIVTVRADGTPVYPTEVSNSLLNATMAYLLTQNASNVIPATDYLRFGEISLFYNRKVVLDGTRWILSCDMYTNADKTVWRLFFRSLPLLCACHSLVACSYAGHWWC